MTQECLQQLVTYYACKAGTLGSLYYKQLCMGSSCAQNTLLRLVLATALIELICDLNIEEEGCLTEEEVCDIIEKIKEILYGTICNCGC